MMHLRETVRVLLAVLDPEGCDRQKRKRLHRRCYINKVHNTTWTNLVFSTLRTCHSCTIGWHPLSCAISTIVLHCIQKYNIV